jgi:AraC-like DNA-binding protein
MIIKIKKRDSLFISLFFLLFIQLSSTAQPIEQLELKNILIAKIDSCNNNLLQLDQDQKIKILHFGRITGEYTLIFDFFNHKKLYGEEYQTLMYKYISENNLDSIYLYFKKADNYYRDNEKNSESLIIYLHEQLVTWSMTNNYSELAINSLKQVIQYKKEKKIESYLWYYAILTQIYSNLGKFEQAIESGKIGLRQTTNKDKHSNVFKTTTYLAIAENYYLLEDYQNSLAYTDSAFICNKNTPNKFDSDYPGNPHNITLLDYYSINSANYSSLKKFKQASLMIEKADSLFSIEKGSNISYNYKYDTLAQQNWMYIVYYYHKGDYTKALEWLNKSKQLPIGYGVFQDSKNLVKWETRILEKMGKYEQAYWLLKEHQHNTDSINKANSSKEINAVWAVFEVDKAQQEKEQSELRAKNITISTSIIVLIAIVVIIYFVITNKKLKAKNMVLFKQQKNQPLNISLISKRTSANESKIPDNVKNEEQTLYLEIIEYLQTTKRYTDPNISRESLAKDLGSNRQYIIDAISNNAQMTFNEFINNFRINYARDLLLSGDNIMIKKVYTDAGFNSRSTFTILFKEKFGMTPSEFRDCVNEETK